MGYVRQWLLAQTRLLASIDLHPDTFQPSTSVQTSVIVIQRKTRAEIALEAASGVMADYEIFMAVADHIGHDKRGNVTYVRDEHGNEIIVEVDEALPPTGAHGEPNRKSLRTHTKLVDDNTLSIAEAFLDWRREIADRQ